MKSKMLSPLYKNSGKHGVTPIRLKNNTGLANPIVGLAEIMKNDCYDKRTEIHHNIMIDIDQTFNFERTE